MRFYHRGLDSPRRLGVLPGSFNPLTIAHIDLIHAAGPFVDEVLCVVPRTLPHKDYFGATLEQRVGMLESAGLTVPHSIADTDQSLFIDIARQCKLHYGDHIELAFLCGRDAAERIMTWDYGRPGVVEEMLREFELLVAPRGGRFTAPREFQDRVHVLEAAAGHDQVSSTEVRERIARAEPWEHLVPRQIVEQVRKIYS